MSHRTHRPRSPLKRPRPSSVARACLLIGSPLLPWLLCGSASAQSIRDEEELAASLGDRVVLQSQEVSIATGRAQPLRRAPAVASVITAEDISRIGATDLDEVMETVPGVHVSRNVQAYNPLYLIRGIYGQFNPQTLVLLDGMPLTMQFIGNRGNGWAGMPLENIARVEVIRGPGSAMYGADAYSGVINLVTKEASDIQGTQVGARVGSFQSRSAWAMHGGQWGPWEVAAYLQHAQTDGDNPTIAADAQTQIDKLYGTHASLAPGQIHQGNRMLDSQLSLKWGHAQVRIGHLGRDQIGLGGGTTSSLDPTQKGRTQRTYLSLAVNDVPLSQDWRVQAHLTGLYLSAQNDPLLLYPAGAWGGAFPNGMYGSPNTWERQWRGTVMATYAGWSDHTVSIGLGHEDLNLNRTREYKTFALSLNAAPTPLGDGSIVEVPVEDSFIKPHRRQVDHLILQDEWNLARDWTLTTGLRHDRYSDVGSTTNPRVALVWDTSLDVTTKLLHGRAFRAPAFMELYSINNPVLRGNPDLKPETIQTTELAFSWQARSDTLLQLSLFRYGMSDIIAPTGSPQVFQNTGKQNGQGFELEARHDLSPAVSLSGNYAFQRSIDETSGKDAGYAPRHHLYGRADWRWYSGWQWSSQVNHVAGRHRPPGDTREPVRDQTTMDLTLRSPRSASGWEFRASVRNLFDAKVEEPSLYSPGESIPVLVPGDLPMAGRSFFVQLSLQM